MIDTVLYRQRIGSFSQKIKNKRFLKYLYFETDRRTKMLNIRRYLLSRIFWVRAVIIICTIISLSSEYENRNKNEICHTPAKTKFTLKIKSLSCQSEDSSWTIWSNLTGNFFARYMNGNGRNSGVRSFHLNIRKLQNKVSEVKKAVKELKNPHMFGISECELRKNSPNFDIEKLKVPGYNIHFPKSWDIHGYARVVLYYKNTFECPRVHELEDEHLQSIWVKFGFKNSKAGYYCHTYREHTSNLGNSLHAQREKLRLLVDQCETALNHGNPTEQNEVFILGDINLDSYKDRWLQRDYSLYSLAQIMQEFCNSNSVSQLVTDITRAQYNSVAQKTDLSCIDHIYTNCKYKCSAPTITNFGDSDHDIVGFVRLSKEPQESTRTIRKRSYKYFDTDQFLEDVSEEDWTEVLVCKDLDEAVATFTMKFKYVLNMHAPWVLFQQRKDYKPWITKETKELMSVRDEWKKKAVELSVNNIDVVSTKEETEAWAMYKKFRNLVNNTKKNEEYKYSTRSLKSHQSAQAYFS